MSLPLRLLRRLHLGAFRLGLTRLYVIGPVTVEPQHLRLGDAIQRKLDDSHHSIVAFRRLRAAEQFLRDELRASDRLRVFGVRIPEWRQLLSSLGDSGGFYRLELI